MGILEEFKKPEIKLQRLKLMIYGMPGTGKSTMAASFKDCAYLDTEDIMSKPKYQRLMTEKKDNSLAISTDSLDKIMGAVKELIVRKHNFKTVVIDSLTVAYTNSKTEAAKIHGSKYGADAREANKKIRELCSLLLKVDMNVVVTCHGKKEYDSSMQVSGQTFDGYTGLGYIFDVVLESLKLGSNFSAMIHKSRLDNFDTGDEITFSYEDVIRRCGADMVEREVVTPVAPPPASVVKYASTEKIDELNKLIILCGKEKEVPKWLKKAKCATVDKMPIEFVDKCIKFLSDELNKEQH